MFMPEEFCRPLRSPRLWQGAVQVHRMGTAVHEMRHSQGLRKKPGRQLTAGGFVFFLNKEWNHATGLLMCALHKQECSETTPKIHFEIFTLAFASRPQTCGHVEINCIPNTPNQYCPTTKFPQDNGGWSTRNFRFYKAVGSFKHL